MKIYYIKNGKCKDITTPVAMIVGGVGLGVIALATPIILNTGTSALAAYTYDEYCREVYKALLLNRKHFIPLRL